MIESAYYRDPNLVGWRGNIARAARKGAALSARANRIQGRARRVMAERVAFSLAERAAAEATKKAARR